MSFKATALFAALLFALALVSAPPAAACDTGGVQPGNPTFSLTAPQQVYQTQAFVAQPVVTQQFVAQPQYVQQFAVQPQVQVQAFAVHQPQAFALRGPRRQVQRNVQVNRAGVLGFRQPRAAVAVGVGY
jgi:hypothetical protein